jgi:hypothetical protein
MIVLGDESVAILGAAVGNGVVFKVVFVVVEQFAVMIDESSNTFVLHTSKSSRADEATVLVHILGGVR